MGSIPVVDSRLIYIIAAQVVCLLIEKFYRMPATLTSIFLKFTKDVNPTLHGEACIFVTRAFTFKGKALGISLRSLEMF